ncbi:hypothetical protein D9M72_457440 [compost metagenome]
MCTTCSRSGRSLRSIRLSLTHSAHGLAAATSALTSSSSMIRPASVSTRNILPGETRPFLTTLEGSTSMTPTSEANTTNPSSVIQYRPGRRPLRSSVAPTRLPSVKETAAGPSHGSISREWYS